MLFPPEQTHSTTDKGHGRIEERTIQVLNATPAQIDFPFANQIFQIQRTITIIAKNSTSTEVVYGVSSLTAKRASPERLLDYNRGHWSIENKVHCVRDTTMAEDQSRIRKGNGPRVMATLRNLVLSILRAAGITNIAEKLQEFAYNRTALLRFAGIQRCAGR